MSEIKVFYSWQSHEEAFNRYYLTDILQNTMDYVNSSQVSLYKIQIEQATRGIPGSPDIATELFRKINTSHYFIADVSLVGKLPPSKKSPNPNVLIELGYASSKIGWDNILLLFNKEYGDVSELPFDIRGRRIEVYRNSKEVDKDKALGYTKSLNNLFGNIFTDLAANTQPLESHAVTKLFAYLNNRLVSCSTIWTGLIREMYNYTNAQFEEGIIIDEGEFLKVCQSINPNNKVGQIHSFYYEPSTFKNWLNYVRYAAEKIREIIFNILHFYSELDFQIVGYLAGIETQLNDQLILLVRSDKISNNTFDFAHHVIYSIYRDIQELCLLFNEKYSEHRLASLKQFEEKIKNRDK